MKKIYLLALLSTCLSLSIFAKGIEINGIYYLLNSTNYTASVTYTGSSYSIGNNYAGEVAIPSSVDYDNQVYDVTSIGDYAFYNCNNLTSIEIPNSVISIKYGAFSFCSNLASISIGNSVASIGSEAFTYCTGLTSITIPNSVTSIESRAFYYCTDLSAINVAYDNPNFSSLDGVFFNKDQTRLIQYPIKKADTEYVIPNSVTSIDDMAFYSCKSLTSITIPNSVTSIGKRSFENCTGLTSITIPNSVTSIGDDTFSGCSGLTSVTIPNSVISIGCEAFYFCSSLTSVTIPNSVTSIGNYAFSGCRSLTQLVVDSGNTVYDSRNNCNAIIETTSNTLIVGCLTTDIPNNITCIWHYAFSYYNRLTSINIPNSVKSIGSSAFKNCPNLTSATIGNGITNIGNYAFESCSKLDTMICNANTPPTLESGVFSSISPTAVLLVPYESIDAYEAIAGYADSFAEIKGFSDVEDITDTAATLKWIPDTAVTQYDINVYTSDTLFVHYVVDGNGQIIPSQSFAPSIYKQKLDTTVSSTDYFVITLSGLSAGTDYTYTIQGINADNAPIYHEEGSFTTLHEGEEGLFDAIADDPRKQTIKILRDGQIYILRREKVYTVTGQEVK